MYSDIYQASSVTPFNFKHRDNFDTESFGFLSESWEEVQWTWDPFYFKADS